MLFEGTGKSSHFMNKNAGNLIFFWKCLEHSKLITLTVTHLNLVMLIRWRSEYAHVNIWHIGVWHRISQDKSAGHGLMRSFHHASRFHYRRNKTSRTKFLPRNFPEGVEFWFFYMEKPIDFREDGNKTVMFFCFLCRPKPTKSCHGLPLKAGSGFSICARV